MTLFLGGTTPNLTLATQDDHTSALLFVRQGAFLFLKELIRNTPLMTSFYRSLEICGRAILEC